MHNDPTLTRDQFEVLRLVQRFGNKTLGYGLTPDKRKGASASRIAHHMGWMRPRSRSFPEGGEVPATRAAVNRLLVLRSRGLISDIEGRWFTTDDGERKLLGGYVVRYRDEPFGGFEGGDISREEAASKLRAEIIRLLGWLPDGAKVTEALEAADDEPGTWVGVVGELSVCRQPF